MAFLEKTELEKGFAALWAAEVEPSLAPYRAAYRPRFWLAVPGQPLALPLAFLGHRLLADGMAAYAPEADPGFAVLAGWLLAGGLMIGFCLPLSKLHGSFDSFLKQVVSTHYGDILTAVEGDGDAGFLTDRLQEFGLIANGRRSLSNHYVGRYRDCRLEMFNICLQRGHGKNRRSDDYFILDVSVPRPFDGAVVIKPDAGRAVNFLRSLFSKRKQVRFDHAAFEQTYEVYAEDDEAARHLINPAFCDNMLAVPALFPRAYGLLPNHLCAAFHAGRFTLAVPRNADLFGLWPHQTVPWRIESGCRRLIARMGIIKTVVDRLHGEG